MITTPTRTSTTLPPPANLRDLGGLPTTGGGQVAAGRLLRSADLAPVDPAVLVDVCAHVDLVIDLRSDDEVAAFGPAQLPAHVQLHRVPLRLDDDLLRADDDRDEPDGASRRRRALRRLPDSAEELGLLYVAGIEANAARLAETVTLVAEQDRASLLHCVAGKDRTGIVTALLLEIVGVDRDAIVADYAATMASMPAVFAQMAAAGATVVPGFGAGIEELPPVLFDAPPLAMATCLAELDGRYGTPAALLGEQGLEAATCRRLREHLVA